MGKACPLPETMNRDADSDRGIGFVTDQRESPAF